MSSYVMCIDSKIVEPFKGLTILMDYANPQGEEGQKVQMAFLQLTMPRRWVPLRRDYAETEPRYKQIIPYVVVRCGDEILSYRRPATHTDQRLASQRSIGFGGHLHEGENLAKGMRRELFEELGISDPKPSVWAVVNDDSTPIGQVHIGVVYLLELCKWIVLNPSEEIEDLQWVKDVDSDESWTALIMKGLKRG